MPTVCLPSTSSYIFFVRIIRSNVENRFLTDGYFMPLVRTIKSIINRFRKLFKDTGHVETVVMLSHKNLTV